MNRRTFLRATAGIAALPVAAATAVGATKEPLRTVGYAQANGFTSFNGSQQQSGVIEYTLHDVDGRLNIAYRKTHGTMKVKASIAPAGKREREGSQAFG